MRPPRALPAAHFDRNETYAYFGDRTLEAIAEGFRHLGFKDDYELNSAEWIVYDALYAYCQEMVRQGKHDGAFKGDPSGSPAGSVNPYDRTGQQAGPKQ